MYLFIIYNNKNKNCQILQDKILAKNQECRFLIDLQTNYYSFSNTNVSNIKGYNQTYKEVFISDFFKDDSLKLVFEYSDLRCSVCRDSIFHLIGNERRIKNILVIKNLTNVGEVKTIKNKFKAKVEVFLVQSNQDSISFKEPILYILDKNLKRNDIFTVDYKYSKYLRKYIDAMLNKYACLSE